MMNEETDGCYREPMTPNPDHDVDTEKDIVESVDAQTDNPSVDQLLAIILLMLIYNK